MSQTLAQRRVLATHARHRTPSEPSTAPPSSAPHDEGAPARAGDGGPTDPSVSAVPADPADPIDTTGSSRPPRDPRAPQPDRSSPMAGPAGRAVLTLVRSGARIVEVGPGRVRLHREGTECDVDPRGRVDWRAR